MTPRQGQPVWRTMSRTPSSKRAGSPRSLLTAKLRIIAASAGSSTALVPATAAMTPPRSMSASRHTGTCARRAKPMLAMSRARRLISAALPAPSTITRSQAPASRSKLSITGASRRSRLGHVVGRSQVRGRAPVHHDLGAPVALGLEQHRVHVDAGCEPRRARLQCLRPPDLAAARTGGGVVRHVLGLEGGDCDPAPAGDPAQARHHDGLAGVGAGPLDHQRPASHR